MQQQTFDEQAQTAFRILLERFWVLRLKEPETYQLIREREKVLKRYFVEKFGFARSQLFSAQPEEHAFE